MSYSSYSPSGQSGNIIPKGYNYGQLQQFTPQQMQLFKSLFGQVSSGSPLSRLAGGDESSFAQMEAPALRQFNQLQGNIASRFSGQGLGGRQSSGFQNTMNAASRDFASDLQSQRQQLQRQALLDLLGISETLLGQRPYEQILAPKQQKKKSFLESLLGVALPSVGSTLGSIAGGSTGAQQGSNQGSALASLFSR